MEFSRIADYMQASLTGKRLRYITRSCELVDLGLGDIITRRNRFGNDTKVATLSLHLQCPFRITRQSGILIGSDDLFVSSSSAGNVVDLGEQCRRRGLTHSVRDSFYNPDKTREERTLAENQMQKREQMNVTYSMDCFENSRNSPGDSAGHSSVSYGSCAFCPCAVSGRCRTR